METRLGLGQSVQLAQDGAAQGEYLVRLMWTELQGMAGRQPVDIDLGCLYQLSNGDIGCIQALGDMYGNFMAAPYIELDHDDRTGRDAGETLRINGQNWSKINRLCVFAYIYDGITSWSGIETIAQIMIPGHAPVMIELVNPRDDRGMCAIAMIENKADKVMVTKLSDYFETHKDLDEQYRFGLHWEIAAKRG